MHKIYDSFLTKHVNSYTNTFMVKAIIFIHIVLLAPPDGGYKDY